eukprot:4963550-Lingulodinium_polyedra.AAC.1
MPLVAVRWGRTWAEDVYCYDSCPEGFGAARGQWPANQVGRRGRALERSRFKRARGGFKPRRAAARRFTPDV